MFAQFFKAYSLLRLHSTRILFDLLTLITLVHVLLQGVGSFAARITTSILKIFRVIAKALTYNFTFRLPPNIQILPTQRRKKLQLFMLVRGVFWLENSNQRLFLLKEQNFDLVVHETNIFADSLRSYVNIVNIFGLFYQYGVLKVEDHFTGPYLLS